MTPSASAGRRLGALLYDTLLLLAVLFAATALFVAVAGWLGAATGAIEADSPLRHPFQLYLLGVTYAYFGGFWTRAGYTPGMRAWRIRLRRADGGAVGWADAARRLGAAAVALLPAGLGLLWMLVDRDGLAWHDRLSATRVVRDPDL